MFSLINKDLINQSINLLFLTSSQLKSGQSFVGVILVTKVDKVDSSRGFNFVVRLSVTLMKKSLKCSAFVRSSANRLLF